MLPFKVYDRDNKATWLVLNYQGSSGYLCAREDDSDEDGMIKIIPSKTLSAFKLIELLDDTE